MNRSKRAARHRRWQRRSLVWRNPPRPTPDPLIRRGRRLALAPWVAATVAAHVAVLLALPAGATRTAPTKRGPVAVTFVETPAPTPEPTPVVAPEPEAAPRRAPVNRRSRPKPEPTVKAPPPKPTPEPAKPKRLVVGISLSSTVKGGTGPSFAVGTTRHGTTAATADTPSDAEPDVERAAPAPKRRTKPAQNAKLEKPRRLVARQPDYPEAYRQKGLEARVTVEMTIGVDGRTRDIKLVAASKHDAFNDAARQAAARERFTPARRGGTAIPFVLRFTYHFRLST